MKRISLLAGSALALFAISAHGGTFTITATPGRTFDPPELTINVGDTVTFVNGGGFHNVASDPDSVQAFRCANGCDETGGNGDPDSNSWSATVTFTAAGSAPFHCEVHEGQGMVGTITIVGTGGAPSIDVTPGTLDGAADQGASTSVPLSIGNTGDADLTWTAATAPTDCATPETVPWLTLDPVAGTVVPGDPATAVNVTMDAADLVEGVYNAVVCVDSNDTLNALVAVPVAFTVTVGDRVFENGFDP
jgi:plastocyanin